jgi:hypothetical protein
VKAERFVTKREALMKKRRHIFTYFTTMPIKNEKKGKKNRQLFPGRQNFVAGTHMNMYVSVYVLYVYALVLHLLEGLFLLFFSHFIVYCSRSVYLSIIYGEKTQQ